MFRLLILPLVAIAFSPAGAERYVNDKYGLSFDLPAGADVCRSPEPLPNHGLLFRPAGVTSPPCDDDIEDGSRYTSADAHFDVDHTDVPATFVSKTCPELALDSRGRVTAMTVPVRFGNLPWAGCRIDGADGSILEIIFAQRRETAGVPTIDYTFVLRTTPQAYVVDHAAFVRWLATIRLMPA